MARTSIPADVFAAAAAGDDTPAAIVYPLSTDREPSRWPEIERQALRRETRGAEFAAPRAAFYEELVDKTAARRLAGRFGTNAP